VAGLVAPKARVNAGEVLTLSTPDELYKACLGPGQVTPVERRQGLLGQQLSVGRVVPAPFAADRQGLCGAAQPTVALRDEREELAHDRVGRVRARQAPGKQRERLGGLP
jgi:hypothetical protein